MINQQLCNTNFPHLTLSDTVAAALQIMEDYQVQHLPVVAENDLFVGLVAQDDLLDANDKQTIESLQESWLKAAVQSEAHFSAALKVMTENNLTVIPVVNPKDELQGVITQTEMLNLFAKQIGVEEPGGIIVLEMEKRNFSFGEISKLVETNDAYITQLNTSNDPTTGNVMVTLKVNKMEISDIVSTFQRYEYSVKYYFGDEHYENELQSNYDHLMSYLNI
jgi:acetoin utilization protein AcuB